MTDSLSGDPTWLRRLSKVQSEIGANAAALSIWSESSRELLKPIAATWSDTITMDYVDNFRGHDSVTPRIARVGRGQPIRLQELVAMREYSRTEFFNEWADKNGIAYLLGISFPVEDNAVGILTVNRAAGDPEFSEHDGSRLVELVRPLQRTLIEQERADLLTLKKAVLNSRQSACLVLHPNGDIRYCTPLARQVLEQRQGVFIHRNRLRATDERTHRKLTTWLRRASLGDSRTGDEPLVIPDSFLLLEIAPIARGPASGPGPRPLPCVVYVHDPRAHRRAIIDRAYLLRERWGLTPTEAEIAIAVADGKQLVTRQRGRETVRTHLKHIYQKLPLDENSQVALTRFVERYCTISSARHRALES